jgi:hypothetical protein
MRSRRAPIFEHIWPRGFRGFLAPQGISLLTFCILNRLGSGVVAPSTASNLPGARRAV